MKSRTRAELQIVAAAVLFSTGGAAIKATHFSGWQVAGFRSAIAALVLLALLPSARRGYTLRGALVALPYAITMILFVLGNKLTTSMNTIFLQGAAPFYVLALSPWLLKERIHRRDLGFMAVILVGLVLFFVHPEKAQQTATNPFLGNVLALISGVSWALTIMGLRWLGKDGREGASLSCVVMGNVITALFCLPQAVHFEGVRGVDWVIVAYLGAFQIGLAYVCLTRGLAGAPAFAASVLLLAEPVFNPIWSFFVHGERPGVWAIAGAMVILAATLCMAWRGEGARGEDEPGGFPVIPVGEEGDKRDVPAKP